MCQHCVTSVCRDLKNMLHPFVHKAANLTQSKTSIVFEILHLFFVNSFTFVLKPGIVHIYFINHLPKNFQNYQGQLVSRQYFPILYSVILPLFTLAPTHPNIKKEIGPLIKPVMCLFSFSLHLILFLFVFEPYLAVPSSYSSCLCAQGSILIRLRGEYKMPVTYPIYCSTCHMMIY